MTLLAPRHPRLAIAGGLMTALVAALAMTGGLRSLDQYAVDHWMPWLRPGPHPLINFAALTVPRFHPPAANVALDLWTYPAAVLPSLVIVLFAASRMARRDAFIWPGLWCAGNAIELAGKLSLHKPALHHHARDVAAFDTSLPSGHTIRSFVVAGAVASAWQSGRPAFVWAATVPFALVVLGAHTPSDVLTGVFVAMTLAAWAPNVRTE